jgi:hypothetical protein
MCSMALAVPASAALQHAAGAVRTGAGQQVRAKPGAPRRAPPEVTRPARRRRRRRPSAARRSPARKTNMSVRAMLRDAIVPGGLRDGAGPRSRAGAGSGRGRRLQRHRMRCFRVQLDPRTPGKGPPRRPAAGPTRSGRCDRVTSPARRPARARCHRVRPGARPPCFPRLHAPRGLPASWRIEGAWRRSDRREKALLPCQDGAMYGDDRVGGPGEGYTRRLRPRARVTPAAARPARRSAATACPPRARPRPRGAAGPAPAPLCRSGRRGHSARRTCIRGVVPAARATLCRARPPAAAGSAAAACCRTHLCPR